MLDSKALTGFFLQAGFGTAFAYLTSGVFLSGLAILMGAGDVLVSYLSVIINICGVLILVFSGFLERFKSRRRLTIGLTVLSRLATLFIAVIPAVLPAGKQLAVFILAVIVAFTLQAQTTVVLNQWMLGFMDKKKSWCYISLRQTLALGVTVVLSITAGSFIDLMEQKYIGFAILFAGAAIMGIVEVILLFKTPDIPERMPASCKLSFWDLVKLPLQNRRFTGFVAYIVMFYLLLNISDSFTMVYMMKYLALPYRTVTILYMIISLPQIILLSIWGRISDKHGHEFVLKTSMWLFAGETGFMFFVSPKSWFIFIPLSFLAASVGNAGFITAVFNRRYELMPKENRIVYDNFYTAAIGVGFILGPMTGGCIKAFLKAGTSAVKILPFAGIRLLYLISAAGILLLQFIYRYTQKRRLICEKQNLEAADCAVCGDCNINAAPQ